MPAHRNRCEATPRLGAHVGADSHQEHDGDHASACRASITRFAVITEAHVYARNDPYERHAQRSQPKQRLRNEITISGWQPRREWLSRYAVTGAAVLEIEGSLDSGAVAISTKRRADERARQRAKTAASPMRSDLPSPRRSRRSQHRVGVTSGLGQWLSDNRRLVGPRNRTC